MTPLKLAAASTLIALAVGGATQSCDLPQTSTTGAGMATVTGTESSGDKTSPTGLTHYADCRADTNGTEFRVIVSAATEYSLRSGQPCPAGQRVPTARQQNPELYDEIQSALNAPLPYSGGDPNGPCGSWGAADKADADQMRADYEKCMANGGNR